MKRLFDTLMFDFDYTLADSSVGVGTCINHALAALGFPAVAPSVACGTIGLSLRDTFTTLVGTHHHADADAFARLFVTHADQILVEQTTLLATAHQTIARLHAQSYQLGIVSNNRGYRIESVLAREGLAGHFRAIIGEEHVTRHKPEPDGLLMAIRRVRSTPTRTLYIGDSRSDAETARRAGVAFVAVLSGTTPRAAFAHYDVYATLDSLTELPDCLATQPLQAHCAGLTTGVPLVGAAY